ncbi:MAG: nucleotidyltransferase family protein [Acidimicrobiales bacterium]|nr:nucleotidyltransferase family protein [Acidimicrobiales bacterium]
MPNLAATPSPLVDPTRRSLLLAAVCAVDAERARGAWDRLEADCGGPAGVLVWAKEGSEQRLLPLLGARAEMLDLPEQVRAGCHEATVEAWGLNERLLHATVPVLDAFRAAGIEVLALKGLGLLGDTYPQHRLRPVGDADLLVRPDRAADAYRIVTGLGWRDPSVVVRPWPSGRHSVNLGRIDGPSIDLHRRPGSAFSHRGSGQPPCWEAAEPLPAGHPLAGTHLRRPGPAQHLVIIAAHAARRANGHVAHPLADIHHLLVAHPHLDGRAVAAAAAEQLVAQRVGDVLAAVGEAFGTPLPLRPEQLRPRSPAAQRAEQRAVAADARVALRRPGAVGAGRRFVDLVATTAAGQGLRAHVEAGAATVQAWGGPRLAARRRRRPRAGGR